MSHMLVNLWVFTLLNFLLFGQFHLEAKSLGITIDVIHRDSPLSPLYNPMKTPMERYQNALRWSKYRSLSLLSSHKNTVESRVASDNGGYLIDFSIGTPSVGTLVKYYGVLDSGSDLIWVQCIPCLSCYKQMFPLFNPKTSTTYVRLSCSSQPCQQVQHVCSSQNSCEYTYGYGNGDSYTNGDLSTETLILTNSTSTQPSLLKNIVFGCGFNNTGMSDHVTGILGIGRGPLSLVSQVGSQLGSLKFSQCLVPFETNPSITSKFIIGVDVNAEDKSIISTTPLVDKDNTLYFITLEGFTIGKKYIPYNALNETTLEKGNMFIDSGITNVILPQDLFKRFEDEIMSQITIEPIQEMRPQLCYKSESEISNPVVTAHFDGGVNVTLNPGNLFIPVQAGIHCFTVMNKTDSVGVLGNFGQTDMSISFDLEKKTVSFKPTDCTKDH